LESFTGLSLDPKSPNFISRVIGDYVYNYNPSTIQIELTGSYRNNSNYIYVDSVNLLTPDYLDNNGVAKPQFTSSIPLAASGSFTGATGTIKGGAAFYNSITNANNTQGLEAANYTNMVNLLSNKDDYQFNVLITPGIFDSLHTSTVSTLITNTQQRGDNIFVVDPVVYGQAASAVISQASTRDTSYAAEYWPWCQIQDPATGKNVWVPASTMIVGVYAYNDTVAEPWFAPAGINRGGLGTVLRVEQKLNQTTRDSLYTGKVNPIATFPGQGIVVYGQKTLQQKPSALDRVNVRRLLISLKSYISQVANNLVFEQNTIATRNTFLSQVNPYLSSVQQRQGLYAFKVVMDETNNTADVIDRNQLIGQIYVQPTKTAEFIYLDFIITPTGATFPA
jgi:phage tail sheath protein FI